MTPALKQWARALLGGHPSVQSPGAYTNFMMDNEGEAHVQAATAPIINGLPG
jgi:hypothetical protein